MPVAALKPRPKQNVSNPTAAAMSAHINENLDSKLTYRNVHRSISRDGLGVACFRAAACCFFRPQAGQHGLSDPCRPAFVPVALLQALDELHPQHAQRAVDPADGHRFVFGLHMPSHLLVTDCRGIVAALTQCASPMPRHCQWSR
jgi:hypothetical protein